MQLFRSPLPTKPNYDNAQFTGQDLLWLLGSLCQPHQVPFDPFLIQRQFSPSSGYPSFYFNFSLLPPIDSALSAGSGTDQLYGSNCNDALFGGGGNDLLVGGGGDDVILSDRTATQAMSDWNFIVNHETNGVEFTRLNQEEAATGGADNIYAGAGNDFIYAGAGADAVDGGTGNDIIFGESGKDFITGGTGDDTIQGDANWLAANLHDDDYIDGGEGNDLITGNGGNDEIFGGALCFADNYTAAQKRRLLA